MKTVLYCRVSTAGAAKGFGPSTPTLATSTGYFAAPLMPSGTPAANRLATTEISPSLHDCSAPIKAVGAPISSLHRSPDLMA